jgi:hypothetical protein
MSLRSSQAAGFPPLGGVRVSQAFWMKWINQRQSAPAQLLPDSSLACTDTGPKSALYTISRDITARPPYIKHCLLPPPGIKLGGIATLWCVNHAVQSCAVLCSLVQSCAVLS